MRRHRFYVPIVDRSLKVITDRAQVHQMRDVLRAKVGDELLLWKSGEGADYVFTITHMTPLRIEGVVSETIENDREPRNHIVLYCALLKRENFELVLQKAVEVGVGIIIPIVSQRTVKARLNMDRGRAIIQEAAEQSGRGVLPVLGEVIFFTDAFEYAGNSERYFFHAPSVIPNARGGMSLSLPLYAQSLQGHAAPRSLLSSQGTIGSGISLFIGPEGGWTDEEVGQAQVAGCHIVSLCPLTLRAETAAIVASYLACV